MSNYAETLSKHPTLTSLELDECELSNSNLTLLLSNTNLKTLTLRFSSVTLENALLLADHPSITKISINSCYIHDEGMIALSKNSRLKTLYLCNGNYANYECVNYDERRIEAMIALSRNSTLTALDVKDHILYPECIINFASNNLQELHFNNYFLKAKELKCLQILD